MVFIFDKHINWVKYFQLIFKCWPRPWPCDPKWAPWRHCVSQTHFVCSRSSCHRLDFLKITYDWVNREFNEIWKWCFSFVLFLWWWCMEYMFYVIRQCLPDSCSFSHGSGGGWKGLIIKLCTLFLKRCRDLLLLFTAVSTSFGV